MQCGYRRPRQNTRGGPRNNERTAITGGERPRSVKTVRVEGGKKKKRNTIKKKKNNNVIAIIIAVETGSSSCGSATDRRVVTGYGYCTANVKRYRTKTDRRDTRRRRLSDRTRLRRSTRARRHYR